MALLALTRQRVDGRSSQMLGYQCSRNQWGMGRTITTPVSGARKSNRFGCEGLLGDADPQVAVQERRADLERAGPAWIGGRATIRSGP